MTYFKYMFWAGHEQEILLHALGGELALRNKFVLSMWYSYCVSLLLTLLPFSLRST